jgi:hypothetical protein
VTAFRITDGVKLKCVLDTFAHLDVVRWSQPTNYNFINYCANDLTADEKLLTHWLCYIADRQTSFERVWDVGGYVVSHVVRAYSRSAKEVRELLYPYVRHGKRNGKGCVWLECPIESPNDRLQLYGFDTGNVMFASRYAPEDILLTFRTLTLLDKISRRSLSRFMSESGLRETDQREAIVRVAKALNGLTYISAGGVSAVELDSALDAEKRLAESEAELFTLDRMACLNRWAEKFRSHGKKRLWCSIRDYLKSPAFNNVLVEAIRAVGLPDAERWRQDRLDLRSALEVLELPGDVWNNDEFFRKGLFSPYLSPVPKTWDMPRTIRMVYVLLKRQGPVMFYPEQMDVTFDFVPRMCERTMCDVCLFGAGINKTCHRQEGLLCPVVLTACGYRHTCRPKECQLKQDEARGLCLSAAIRTHPRT